MANSFFIILFIGLGLTVFAKIMKKARTRNWLAVINYHGGKVRHFLDRKNCRQKNVFSGLILLFESQKTLFPGQFI
ncbi:MAG: hypothetical protein IKR18_04405 [Bacteroidaceae bacterium]|nr:hypothetical protein [Bacteroidaceae bacterium]